MPDHAANQGRQKRGFELLAKAMPGFYVPTSAQKGRLLELLGISRKFKQTFDAIRLGVASFSEIQPARDFDLLEIKTTDKCLPNLPEGFFFGLTENEEMLLRVLEGKYFLCFVSLHRDSVGHKLASWKDLQKLIQHKRVQYQINLRGPRARARNVGTPS
ncbi:MAG TPA: hypothetical protein VEG08_05030 [Terriglobales bacterium]|nr:hypothetical protein [Terriglobales bacterium]